MHRTRDDMCIVDIIDRRALRRHLPRAVLINALPLDELLRFALATEAVESVLATMNEHTFVNIVLLESEVGVLCGVCGWIDVLVRKGPRQGGGERRALSERV